MTSWCERTASLTLCSPSTRRSTSSSTVWSAPSSAKPSFVVCASCCAVVRATTAVDEAAAALLLRPARDSAEDSCCTTERQPSFRRQMQLIPATFRRAADTWTSTASSTVAGIEVWLAACCSSRRTAHRSLREVRPSTVDDICR